MLRYITNNKPNLEYYPHSGMRFETLSLDAPVIFLTGDNGSGKSTFLRVVSALADNIQVGRKVRMEDDLLNQEIFDHYTLAWGRKLRKGYTFESEDFYTYLEWAKEEREVYEEIVEAVEARHENKQSMAYLLESGLQKGNQASMNRIVKDFKEVSHGEGTLGFFAAKLRPNALYLLDEPESPLSFENQLSLLRLIHDYTQKGCQFIIATHSPILLAFPGAVIYHFGEQVESISYQKHPIVEKYQSYLENPDRYLHYLFMDEDETNA